MTTRRQPRLLGATLATIGLAAALTGTASAGYRYVHTNFPAGSTGYILWNASCNSDGEGSYAPFWDGSMKEFGESKVKKLTMEYHIYTQGHGIDTITYHGESYVKSTIEYGSFSRKTPTSDDQDWVNDPPKKATRRRALTGDELLVITFRFDRGLLRKDTVTKQVVDFCQPDVPSFSPTAA